MPPARQRRWISSISTEELCSRILERHRDAVRVRKTDHAVANLARIIAATLKLSNQRGFHATSLRDLAQASGLSIGGLYSYFDTKAMLLSMILGEVLASVTEILSAPPDYVSGDPRTHLAWMIDTHIRLSEVMHPWFVFAFMEAKSFPPAERKLAVDAEAMTEKLFADVLASGAASGAFVLDEAGLAASLIKPLLQDWYVKRAKYRKRGTSIETYIAAVTHFVERALAVNLEELGRAAS